MAVNSKVCRCRMDGPYRNWGDLPTTTRYWQETDHRGLCVTAHPTASVLHNGLRIQGKWGKGSFVLQTDWEDRADPDWWKRQLAYYQTLRIQCESLGVPVIRYILPSTYAYDTSMLDRTTICVKLELTVTNTPPHDGVHTIVYAIHSYFSFFRGYWGSGYEPYPVPSGLLRCPIMLSNHKPGVGGPWPDNFFLWMKAPAAHPADYYVFQGPALAGNLPDGNYTEVLGPFPRNGTAAIVGGDASWWD